MDEQEDRVTVDVPLFVPTQAGPMSAMASIPSAGELVGPALALLPGLEAERVRLDVLREVAHALAERGQPVISFDYPGVGMSPSPGLPREEVPSVFTEACDWFLGETGLAELALAGSCGGARMALAIAADNPKVSTVLAQGLPMKIRRRGVKSRVRAGIAALDIVSPKLITPLTRGANVRYSETDWNDDLLRDLSAAAANARVHFVFGELDIAYTDFLELAHSESIPAEVLEGLTVSVLPGESLSLLTKPVQQQWFREIAQRFLSGNPAFENAR
jgi:pimeloyl-ACP methyl ester carboxylesterase